MTLIRNLAALAVAALAALPLAQRPSDRTTPQGSNDVVCVGPDRLMRSPESGSCPNGATQIALAGPELKQLDAADESDPLGPTNPGERALAYNRGGRKVAWMAASAGGGDFGAQSVGGELKTVLGASGQSNGMLITEGDKQRLELGRRQDLGTYRLMFYSSGGNPVAGIGESTAGTGLAFVADKDGTFKARMSVASSTKRGRVWISKSGDETMPGSLIMGKH